jgi:hypothetical protein
MNYKILSLFFGCLSLFYFFLLAYSLCTTNSADHTVYSDILLGQPDRLTELYPSRVWANITEDMVFSFARNAFPTPNGLLLQQVLKAGSFFAWIVFLSLSIAFIRLSKVT